VLLEQEIDTQFVELLHGREIRGSQIAVRSLSAHRMLMLMRQAGDANGVVMAQSGLSWTYLYLANLGSESIRCSSRFGPVPPFSARKRRLRSADADPAGSSRFYLKRSSNIRSWALRSNCDHIMTVPSRTA
jgi:hypothetical protein